MLFVIKDKKTRIKLALKIALIILAIFFLLTFGFALGFGASSGLKVYQIINKERAAETIDFSMFWNIWDMIHSDFLHSYDDKQLFYSSIKGLVAGLNDPYSSFLDPKETKLFNEDMQEEFGGVGIEIISKDDKIVVVSALKDSPAQKAGIKSNDEIIQVDGKDVEGHQFMEVLSWIRGAENTKVKLKINRDNWNVPQEFELTRYKITVESVKWEIKDNIAYIQISQFSDQTNDLMQKAALEINKKSPMGIILDLRNNPGGLFTSAIDAASLFIDKGVVVYERDKKGNDKSYEVNGETKLKDYPLVVLINSGSASASEILAGALSSHKRATLIGEKTFGKGVVQSWQNFNDGSSLILTIAYWLTPNKIGINEKGINPDEAITSDKTDCLSDDAVCNRAKEILLK